MARRTITTRVASVTVRMAAPPYRPSSFSLRLVKL